MTFTTELQHRGDHAVRFYSDDHELVASAAGFLTTGLRHRESLIVVATPAHLDAFVYAMAEAGVDPGSAIDGGRLLLLDAAEVLDGLLRDGRPDSQLFDASVGELVRRTAALGGGVRVYGEMVALLWADGLAEAAVELEVLWNDLADRVPFSLLCAYRCVGEPDPAELARVCEEHNTIVGDAPVATTAAAVQIASRTFEGNALDARVARRFTVEALGANGHGDMVEDAAVVVTELAANAIAHARSCFTVTLSHSADRVRIAVRDDDATSPDPQAPSDLESRGRGLRLVASLAAEWGAETDGHGKVVWAELIS